MSTIFPEVEFESSYGKLEVKFSKMHSISLFEFFRNRFLSDLREIKLYFRSKYPQAQFLGIYKIFSFITNRTF